MEEAFKDPKVLSEAFHKRAGIDQALDRVELITLLKEDLGMHMSHAELEMMMTRIDGKGSKIALGERTTEYSRRPPLQSARSPLNCISIHQSLNLNLRVR